MLAIQLARVAFAYADAAPIFHDLTLRFEPGFQGVAGANGAGKTTLLRLLAGEIAPDAGTIVRTPPRSAVAYCPQRVDEPSRAIDALAAREDGAARTLRATLALDGADVERWRALSPGERRRWQLGAALAEEPDVLLLDEPTNHLDADGRARLVEALGRFRGIGVIVSHDRALLDAITTRTVRVHDGLTTLFAAPYSEARAQWEADARARIEARDRLRADHAAAQRRLVAARERVRGVEAERSTGRRMKDANDSDARGGLAKGRVELAAARLAREASVRRDEERKAAARLDEARVEKAWGGAIALAAATRARRPVLLSLDRDELAVADRVLVRDVHVALRRDDRVWLSGANGAGKTTLLEALLAAAPRADDLFHLPQELDAADARALVDAVRAEPPSRRGEILAHAAALGVDPTRVLVTASPSPGEARKLALARALARSVAGLVLDEPTNHLDLPSIEALEAALASYDGALLLVTHDERLARACTREIWRLEHETLMRASFS